MKDFHFFVLRRYLMYRRRLFVSASVSLLCDEICVELLCFPDTDRFADHSVFGVCVEEVFQKQGFSGCVKEVAAGFQACYPIDAVFSEFFKFIKGKIAEVCEDRKLPGGS